MRQNQNCISIQINEFTADGWTQSLLWWAIFCFVAIFSYIAPWVVCLFPATEVPAPEIRSPISRLFYQEYLGCQDRQIIVNWQSPVGFRSLIGNCFFSSDDMMWNRIKRFIMRIFILPVLFFLPALFVEYLQYNNILPRYNFLNISHLFSSVKVLCYCCYCLQAFLCSFSSRKPNDWGFGIIRDLLLQMLIHFRAVHWCLETLMLAISYPSILMVTEIMDARTRLTVSQIMMRVCGQCLLILLAPFFLFILFCMPCYSFPIAIVCGTGYFSFSFTRKGECFILFFCISCFATYGALLVLRSTGLGILLSLKLAGEILFCEETLPYVTAFGVLAYYLWSSYGSFTKRYKKLAWALCNHYEKQTGIDRLKSPYLLKKIPKTLFDKSGEDTFPIKENEYKLIWKVLYLTFFGAVLFLTMLLDATSLTRTLVVAFTGAAPKIITFFVEKRKSLRNEDMTIDEKALQLVQQYFAESTPKLNKKNVMRYYDDLDPLRSNNFVTSLGPSFIFLSFFVIIAYVCFDLFSVSSW